MVGRTVGKYQVLERIGRGGMGTVYRALDETLDRAVAIKVLNADLGQDDVLKRFRGEAVTLARLNHPGIATIYELHRQQDELLMVMEFVRGETFHDLADRVGPLEPPQAAHLCIQLLDALGYAHRAGVVHRDLKPANLMVTETGTVKVMDFGIARVLGTEHFTMHGLMMGTPAYMAPEQVSGEPIDGRADLYAVGVVFYRLLTGRLPFLADTAIAMVQKQVSDVPTPLSQVRPELPLWCSAIADRALAKRPEDRFQSAEEFRTALTSMVTPQSLGELPTLATPAPGMMAPVSGATPRTLHRTPTSTPATAAAPATAAPPQVRERTTTVVLGPTHLVGIAALVVILCAGIMVLSFAAFRSRSTPVFESSPAVAAAEAALIAAPDAEPVETPAESPAASAPAADTPDEPDAPDPNAATAAEEPAEAALPSVAFGNVRVVVTEGESARETRGMLRIGNGALSMGPTPDAARVLSSLDAVHAIFYSRSKQPRWRDQAGQEVGSRVDLGKMGFLRGDRNWLILITDRDPVILSVEDGQLRQVSQAIEARTGRTVQRFQ